MNRRLTGLSAAITASLILTGCSGSSDQPNAAQPAKKTQIYLVDGNTTQYGDEFKAGTFDGVKGVIPGGKSTDEFRKRLLSVAPRLKDFAYAVESYDSVIVTALAAEAAKSDEPRRIAARMRDVSNGPGEKCTTFAACSTLLKDGAEIDYDGLSGPIDFNRTGSPSAASVGIFQYGKDNTYQAVGYETGKVSADPAPLPSQEISGAGASGDGRLVFGSLLPQTGDLSYLGPPMTAGVKVAVAELNDHGGVLGEDVELVAGDSGDGTPNIAPQETDKLLDQDVDVIVGTASSSVSLSILNKIVNAGVLNISPSVTSPEFDTFPDRGLFFRLMQSDALQGGVLANTMSNDGYTDIAILVRQDAWGQGLAAGIKATFEESGGNVVATRFYAPDSGGFTAEVNAVKATDPDAIALVGFDETKKIVPELIKAGLWMGQ
ncbi:ABC transporter substrate-binding protein [Nonomuraea roseoviolacea]|uniref:ABC-type branched-subunit amino acid transport system substrate-binding protein n=1 Tax=Nonomuraea roseoviolacea subsp. carminata TaxID=160689 RepID=A0ABT1JV72_9ACTN|nr:ABC transporter substrate-binding protein [Nonomuraea roseoviolacea]MCP2345641.1 ABC-type branched-subunit amino acid transport system substrate-binding protein [Nonomuraea roseoviolacea subsp. carminata]